MQPSAIRIGVIGDWDANFPPHRATEAGLEHAARELGISLETSWLATSSLEGKVATALQPFDAIVAAPGSPYQSLHGALQAIRIAREANFPFLGTCGGFQHAALEYARNVLDWTDAQHAEYDPYASQLFVTQLECSLVGRSMDVLLQPGTAIARYYGQTTVREQYYCNFGLNPAYQHLLEAGGFWIVGRDRDGEARILLLSDKAFYVATLFVPQLSSSTATPHPLLVALLETGLSQRQAAYKTKRGETA